MNRNTLTTTIVLISSVFGQFGCRRASTTTELPPSAAVAAGSNSSSAEVTGPVTIEIKATGGSESLVFELPQIADGTTLESLMRSIDQVPIVIRGSGATAFVEKIGEQGTESGKGWTFKVDGEFANQGIGQTSLHPPTSIQWTYGEMPAP